MTDDNQSPSDASVPNPADMNPVLASTNQSMLEGLGELADYIGYNRVMGKMYGALLLNPGPMSLDDLMNHLDISKASVSMNMRTLEDLGIAREVWVRGDRRKYYEAEPDFWKILSNVLGGRELREVNQALTVLDTNIEKLKQNAPTMDEENRDLAEFYIERIAQVRNFFRFAKLVITTFLERGGKFDLDKVTRNDAE